MKNIWTKVGAVALAGVVVCNAFIPFATATDADPTQLGNAATVDTENIAEVAEFFTVESNTLDFGRVVELDRSYTKQIEVHNNTDKDVVIDATVEKYASVPEDSALLSDWLAFVGGVSHFSVAAGQTRSLGVRAFTPADAKSGSQYASVILTDSEGHKETVTAKLDVAGDDLKYASEVVDAWIDPVRIDEGLNARVGVKNTGTAGFTSTYQIKMKNFFGGDDWKVLKEYNEEVYPGGQVNFSANDNLGFGVFSIEQRVTFVNSEGRMIESLLSRTVVNLPWWGIAIAGGALVLIILIIIVAKRRRKAKKASTKAKRAEKKAHKAAIEKIEKAEKESLQSEEESDEEADEDLEQDSDGDDGELEEIEDLGSDDEDKKDEIEQIAEALEDVEEGSVDDDADYDEEEAIPIKVTIKKSTKK